VNGWLLLQHPAFGDAFEASMETVRKLAEKDPEGYRSKAETKLLAAILKLTTEDIPANPADDRYRLGNTIGKDRRHWRRAKFFQQYRLFFRFDEARKIIIYAWVNDRATKRAYGSKTDAYAVFRKRLDRGHPPDDWGLLLSEARAFRRGGEPPAQ
jgi:toxin YhaV